MTGSPKVFILAAALLLALTLYAHADPRSDCAAPIFGSLAVTTGNPSWVPFCSTHHGYFTLQDTKALEPRTVVERLNGKTVAGGCTTRTNNFHSEPNLPTAKPSDYLHSGYDLGHQAPAEDFAWNAGMMPESFSTANMAPQLPGLNRQGWKGLETWVRAAALSAQGDLMVWTGPILQGALIKTIGPGKVAVPAGFYKVVYDTGSGLSWAFIYPQTNVPENAPVAKYQTSVAAVEAVTGLDFALPGNPQAVLILPAADETAWRKEHTAACSVK